MAFNTNHSGSFSEGAYAGSNSEVAGNTGDSISWTDIERALDPASSRSSMNYGKGTQARSESSEFPPISNYDETATNTTDGTQGSLPPMQGNESAANYGQDGVGLTKAGVSPFRGLGIGMEQTTDFFNAGQKTYQGDILASFQADEAPATPGASPRLNSSLLRVIGNLQRRDASVGSMPTPAEPLPPKFLATTADRPLVAVPPGSQFDGQAPEAKLAIGLAIAPGAEVHQPGKVARAVVRLPEAEAVRARVEQEETRPLADPFRHVFEQHANITAKFDGANCKYGRTTLLPDGRTVEVSTAADNTTLTKTKGDNGASSMVVHDRYRRPQTEQDTKPDGSWSYSELSYNDAKGITPFCAEKLTVNSDGTMARVKYSKFGQMESKQLFA